MTNYADGRVSSTVDGKVATTQFRYDANGDTSQLIDSLGNQTSWTYNAMGLPVQENKSGSSRLYEYDRAGNMTKLTDRTGKVTLFAYDALGQVNHESWFNSNGSPLKEFYYDYATAGKLAYTTELDGVNASGNYPSPANFTNQVTLDYDGLGRLRSDTQQWNDVTSKLAFVNYEYTAGQFALAAADVNYADSTSLHSYGYGDSNG